MRARRHGGPPQRRGETTSPPRRNLAAACRLWRTDHRPPPPPPGRRRAPLGATRTRLRSGWPEPSRLASMPCPIGPDSHDCPFPPPGGTTGSRPHGLLAYPFHARSSARASTTQSATRRPPHDAGSRRPASAAPDPSRYVPATGRSRGHPVGSRRLQSARTSDGPPPGRASAPGRRSGYSQGPPDHQRSHRQPPSVPSEGWSRSQAHLPRPARTAWFPVRPPNARSGHESPASQAVPAPRRSLGWPRVRASVRLRTGWAARQYLQGNSGPLDIPPRQSPPARHATATGTPA